jgi:MoaA/NifB/PqqE/SkfB family radical SAM enzyme
MNDRVDPQKNRRALGDSYVERNEISTGLPVYLVIESTSICNLKCVMCPYPTMGRKHEHMKLGLYGKIVSEAAGFVEFMWLHLFGEPLPRKLVSVSV